MSKNFRYEVWQMHSPLLQPVKQQKHLDQWTAMVMHMSIGQQTGPLVSETTQSREASRPLTIYNHKSDLSRL